MSDRSADQAACPAPSAVQREIARAARRFFGELGYAKTNVGDIAQEVGMSPANLYRHFKNKQAIGFAVVCEYLAEERAALAVEMSKPYPSAEKRLRAHATATTMFVARHLRQTPRLVELAEMLLNTEQGLALIAKSIEETLGDYEKIIAEGVAAEEFALPPQFSSAAAAARATHLSLRYFHAPHAIARHGFNHVESDLAMTLDLVCAALRV